MDETLGTEVHSGQNKGREFLENPNIFVFMCVCTCVCIFTCAYMWMPEVDIQCLPYCSPHFFF